MEINNAEDFLIFNINLRSMRQALILVLFLFFEGTTYGQSGSYKDLAPLIALIRSSKCDGESLINQERNLLDQLKSLPYDFADTSTFENFYEQIRHEKLDYRYFLLLAKATNYNVRRTEKVINSTSNLISFYYKALFLKLAIENCGWNARVKDSLKFEYTSLYISSMIKESCFPSPEKFNDFATQNVAFSKELLRGVLLNLTKEERSELYFIVADGLYKTVYNQAKSEYNGGKIIKFLSLAHDENPSNWRALNARADFKKDELKDYRGAIKDYISLIQLFENGNRNRIADHNRRIKQQKSGIKSNKVLFGITPSYEWMFEVVFCYFFLNDNQSALVWIDKSLSSIKQYRQYSGDSEYAADAEGMIHYTKAVTFSELKEQVKACREIEKAIDLGYDFEACKKLRQDLKCN